MISTTCDSLIAINKLPKHLHSILGKKPHLATIYRWINNGISGVRLETLAVGGSRFTSVEALDRFFQQSTEAKRRKRSAENTNIIPRTNNAEAEAKRLGI